MRQFHRVTITVDDLLYLEGLTPEAKRAAARAEQIRERMREAWKRRRERASLEAFQG